MNKKYYETPEREISFRQLLWKYVSDWKKILIWMIVFACLFGVVRYIKNMQNTTSNIQTTDIDQSLTEQEQREVENAWKLEQRIKDKQTYQEESSMMNVDPYHKNVVTLQYYVDSKYTFNLSEDITKDNTPDILQAYLTYIGSRGINSDLNIDDKYAYELISTNNATDAGIFVVFVTGKSEENASELADAVENALEKYTECVSKEIGQHELILLNREQSVVADETLATMQENVSTTISTLSTQLETSIAGFTDVQKKVFEHEDNELEDQTNENVQNNTVIDIKIIVVGALFGMFLYFIIMSLIYILGKDIKNAEEIQKMYGLRILGNVKTVQKENGGILNKIDNWIEYKKIGEKWTQEERLDLIAMNIFICCKKENIKKILFVTSIHLGENENKLINNLVAKLKDKGIEADCGEKLNKNIHSLELLAHNSNVVFIEEVNKTKYVDIEDELKICAEQNVDMMGMVMLE